MAKLKVTQIQKEIALNKKRWRAKETPISILSEEEQKKRLGFLKSDKTPPKKAQPTGAPVVFSPEKDWRLSGNVTPVKDQGNCGSCVSFGTVAVIESMISIEKGLTVDLSEADLHFCSSHGANCNGWQPQDAFFWIENNGITDELCFPYNSAFVGGGVVCNACSNKGTRLYKFNNMMWTYTAEEAKNYVDSIGPITACFDVYADFYSYGGGVYEHTTGTYQGGHCIAVVGYSEAEQCWICKNSWGTAWGEGGYFKIAYGDCGIDSYLKVGGDMTVVPNDPIPPTPVLSVSPSSISAPTNGGSKTVQVTSNLAWAVSTNVPWITLSAVSGVNNGSFILTYAANPTSATRYGYVYVTSDSLTATIFVTQKKAPKGKIHLKKSEKSFAISKILCIFAEVFTINDYLKEMKTINTIVRLRQRRRLQLQSNLAFERGMAMC